MIQIIPAVAIGGGVSLVLVGGGAIWWGIKKYWKKDHSADLVAGKAVKNAIKSEKSKKAINAAGKAFFEDK